MVCPGRVTPSSHRPLVSSTGHKDPSPYASLNCSIEELSLETGPSIPGSLCFGFPGRPRLPVGTFSRTNGSYTPCLERQPL